MPGDIIFSMFVHKSSPFSKKYFNWENSKLKRMSSSLVPLREVNISMLSKLTKHLACSVGLLLHATTHFIH